MLKTFEEKLGFYPYGTQYHRAPTPLESEWADDLKEISKTGYTHVQFRPQWRWHERIHGKFVWDDLDRLFDLAEQNSLRVVLKPMLETAPDWVFEELNGTRIGFHGVPISPVAHGAFYVGGWLPCFDNPKVLRAGCQFVRELVLRYHSHPALWFYDGWNEPRSRPLSQCQCEHSVNSFRNWLRNRFGNIDRLNEEFGKAWTSFEMLRPPTSVDDYVEMYLWRKWAVFAIAEHVASVTETIRQNDPSAFVMVHTGCCSVIQDVAGDACDDILVAEKADRYGTSFPVPLAPETPKQHSMADLISDWLRRVDENYWCHEFYPNAANWSPVSEPRDLKRQIWRAIAGGATGFTFWQYRSERFGNESNGWGMREINGETTPRSEACDSIAQILQKFGVSLSGTHLPYSQVGLLYCRNSDLISRIQHVPENATEQYFEGLSMDYPYKKSLAATHCLYNLNGQPIDFVLPGDDISKKTVIHVSGEEIMDKVTAEWLKHFVFCGGNLIVEFPFACRDTNTWVSPSRPNCGLDELLGCREKTRRIIRAKDDYNVKMRIGHKLQAKGWKIGFHVDRGEIIGRWEDGTPAVVKSSYGKGCVFSLGVSPSLSFSDDWDDPAIDIIGWILSEIGLSLCEWTNRRVWWRCRKGPEYDVWFIFNLSDRDEQILLPSLPNKVWQETGTVLDGKHLTLPAGETWVAELPHSHEVEIEYKRKKNDEVGSRQKQPATSVRPG